MIKMSENLLLSNFKTTENWIEGLIVVKSFQSKSKLNDLFEILQQQSNILYFCLLSNSNQETLEFDCSIRSIAIILLNIRRIFFT